MKQIKKKLSNHYFNCFFPASPKPTMCDYLDSGANFLEGCAAFLTVCQTIDEVINGDKRAIEHERQMAEINARSYASKLAADAELYRLKTIADTEKEERILLAQTEKHIRSRKADADLYEERREVDYRYYRRKKALNKESCTQRRHSDNVNTIEVQPVCCIVQRDDHFKGFFNKFGLPKFPPFIKEFLIECPDEFKVPMLLHILTMLGSGPFSRTRAVYIDGQPHAPNLQTIIEGGSGQGKGWFETVYKKLFGRIIERDIRKLGSDTREIVQTIGSEITPAQLHDMLANNQGVHAYMFEPEILSLCGGQKSNYGITSDLLRKAFDNSAYYRNSSRTKHKGAYPIFLNFTATGTPNDCKRFIKGIECDGNATRIAWAAIPNCGKKLPKVILPDGDKLEEIYDKIDEWTNKYSYSSNDKGDDCVAQEHNIDLNYIHSALEEWLNQQYERAIEESNPARSSIRSRIATMAFHFAIPIHMLYTEYHPLNVCKCKIKELVIYIANYCIERCLYKFSDVLNARYEDPVCEDPVCRTPHASYSSSRLLPSDEELAEWSRLQQLPDDEERMSWQQLADTFGQKYGLGKRQDMINAVRKFRKEHPNE